MLDMLICGGGLQGSAVGSQFSAIPLAETIDAEAAAGGNVPILFCAILLLKRHTDLEFLNYGTEDQ